jgi:peptidyl-tRNA hydrolase, PTH1 family
MPMKLIVGLGNPGKEYEFTRHNLGFLLIDRLFDRANGRKFRDEASSRVSEVALCGQRLLLAKPQTFMNLSGGAVRALLEKYGDGDPSNLIVVSDEAALPFGMIRIRPRGSAGGHNGLKSIIERLGTHEFARLRIGVKPDHPLEDLSDFVLSSIPKSERARLDETLDNAADAIEVVLTEGVGRAMARFNKRVVADTTDV